MDYKKFCNYDEFVAKFKDENKPRTTDECYTSTAVYEVVAEYVCDRFNITPGQIVRPFYPGGDFEHYEYPEGCVVVDNPPFSMRSRILDFYLDNGIRFFLFAHGLTCFSTKRYAEVCNIITGEDVVFENGAKMKIAFTTNMSNNTVETAPELGAAIRALYPPKKKKKKFLHGADILTASDAMKLASAGISLVIPHGEAVKISKQPDGRSIYGGAFKLSESATKLREAAEQELNR